MLDELKKHPEKIDTVGIILYKDDKVLLQYRDPEIGEEKGGGKWGLFGGHIEENEEILDGLIREVEEEIGILLNKEDIEYLGNYPFIDEKTQHIFTSRINFELSDIRLMEGSGFVLIPLKDIKKLELAFNVNELIDMFCKKKKILCE